VNDNIWKIVGGIVCIAIALILFPIVLDGVQAILTDVNISTYTGLEAVAQVTPLLVFVGMIFGGGFLTFSGVKGAKNSKKRR
jgi:hypothetical protein